MIITVLWEDQRPAEMRGFGPHDLLLACVADDTGKSSQDLKRMVKSHPKKGIGNVRKALRLDGHRLGDSGPVLAVVDRDKIRDLWRHSMTPPNDCMSALARQFRDDAPGDYDLVFLIDNAETLTDAACTAVGENPPGRKPNPGERDLFLARATWSTLEVRAAIRAALPSFDRIVTRVVALI